MKIHFKKSLVLAAVTLIVSTVTFSSCDLHFFDYNFGEGDFGFGDFPLVEPETDNIVPAPDYEYGGNISLDKNPGRYDHWNDHTSAGVEYSEISRVYYAVADSVVEITTEMNATGGFLNSFVSEGAGSGVIITEYGLIVTNHHVVDGASNIVVRLTDGSQYRATLVGSDRNSDLAVLKIDPAGKRLTVAPLGCSGDLVVGEDIIVIGNPLGSLGGTLTTGIISATERSIVVDGVEMTLLQTNAAINPGNSGGGLFNMAGELVGIVNAKMAGEDVEGLGFALPIDYAHGIIEDLINYGRVVTE
jgi:serine protease Do